MKIAHYRIDEHTKERTDQSILDHLRGTADRARQFASAFGEAHCAYVIALAHDLGKYSNEFQRKINGEANAAPHSAGGAKVIVEQNEYLFAILAAYCVMGHHGGLPDGGSKSLPYSQPKTLYFRLNDKSFPDFSSYKNEVELPKLSKPDSWEPGKNSKTDNIGFSLSFLTRFLFSCLVDADWLDTENFMQGHIPRGGYESLDVINNKLMEYLKKYDHPIREIDVRRNQLRNDCNAASALSRGLFSLTAPTGSGKTIASLSFALKHAINNGMERIIYVVPYNTIIEQNAQVFEDALGCDNVVQHHHNIEYDDNDRRRFATENWDAPIIVTSNVQFFESLYSNKPSKCRKLHNIANSVIVFDEAQMLPLPYLIPCTAAIGELVKNCNCTAVLMTATQSSLDKYFTMDIKEINSQHKKMYEEFQRVTYRTENEAYSEQDLVEQLMQHEKVLCIVNTRKKAQRIASLIEDSYHLSTTMYPIHRRKILEEIRDKLKIGPCRVVSTSLIEAGVDIDFPVLYREKAGLDSIIQAAGRCNREGINSLEESIVHIFEFDNNKAPAIIQQNIAAFEHVRYNCNKINSLEAVACYFEQLRYIIGESGLDKKNVVKQFNDGIQSALSLPFESVAKDFHLIENNQRMVVVDTDESKTLCNTLRAGVRSRKELRKAQQYSVNLFSNPVSKSDFEHLYECGQLEVLDDGLAIINSTFYDDKYGVSLTPTGGEAIFL